MEKPIDDAARHRPGAVVMPGLARQGFEFIERIGWDDSPEFSLEHLAVIASVPGDHDLVGRIGQLLP